MRLLILACAGLSIALPLRAQTPTVDQQLLAARDTVWRAWYANDTAVLRRFIPPSAAAAEGSGAIHWSDRRAIMDGARGAATSGSKLEKIDFIGTQIDRDGNSAVLRSRFRLVRATGAKSDTSFGQATEVFVRENGHWMNPFWHLAFNEKGGASGRAIDLPDTLGANVTLADSTRGLAAITDYDALVGTWEFRFQSRAPDGSFGAPFTGHWIFEKRAEGGVIEDRWRPDNPGAPMASSLYTFRMFDPNEKNWRIVGASSRGSTPLPGVTWRADASSLSGVEGSGKVLSRFRYFDISPGHFLWRQDRSLDGGKTWILDTGVMEGKRIGK